MLINGSRLLDVPILSLQAGGTVAWTDAIIIDPDTLKVAGFRIRGPQVSSAENILDIRSVREYSPLGMVVDSEDEFVAKDDVIKLGKIIDLHFELVGLKVETRKKAKLGKVIGYTVLDNDFSIQQIIVKRPVLKSLTDSELVISRKEIVSVDDYKIIVKDEEKTLKKRSEQEDFIPNFVNPFRKNPEQDFAPAQSQSPDEQDT